MANVLSIMTGMWCASDRAATSSNGKTVMSGLPSVSPYRILVFGRIASSNAPGLVGSTNVDVMPMRGNVCANWLNVPPYSRLLVTMWSPALHSAMIAIICAACPLLATKPPTPPSSAEMRCSSTSFVGFMIRV